jgi:hypothetical protein
MRQNEGGAGLTLSHGEIAKAEAILRPAVVIITGRPAQGGGGDGV